MTKRMFSTLEFETELEVWEKNRMYPPNHERISMKTVNDSHLRAIARAVHFVRSGMTTKMTPKLLNSIQRDIDLLDEVHKFIRQQIIEPGLPLQPDLESYGLHGEHDGDTDTRPTE